MHIAWLGKRSPFCGNVTYGREITNALLDRGYQVSFLHFAQEDPDDPDDLAEARPLGSLLPEATMQEVSLPFLYKSQIYTIPTWSASKVLAQALARLNPDLVHASLTLSPLDFVLPEICQELGVPLVATFHPPFDRKLRNLASGGQYLTYQLYAPFLAHYDCTIVFSQIQRDVLVDLGVAPERVAVIPNGVDAHKYSPGRSAIKDELGAERLFVYVGRLAQEKNVDALLKAWKRVALPASVRLAIVGNGPLKKPLQSTYGPADNVDWLGFVADEQRRIQILRGADGFILPSLVEGLSLALLEAMSCGAACLATDVGADGEVLAGGAGITLDPQRTYRQLRTFLPFLAEHTEVTALLGQKARARVLERYTLDRNLNALEDLYGRILGDRRPPT